MVSHILWSSDGELVKSRSVTETTAVVTFVATRLAEMLSPTSSVPRGAVTRSSLLVWRFSLCRSQPVLEVTRTKGGNVAKRSPAIVLRMAAASISPCLLYLSLARTMHMERTSLTCCGSGAGGKAGGWRGAGGGDGGASRVRCSCPSPDQATPFRSL